MTDFAMTSKEFYGNSSKTHFEARLFYFCPYTSSYFMEALTFLGGKVLD